MRVNFHVRNWPAKTRWRANDRTFPAPRMTAPLPRTFAALTAANLAAQSAEQLSLAAVPLVAVLLLGAGPGEIGRASCRERVWTVV